MVCNDLSIPQIELVLKSHNTHEPCRNYVILIEYAWAYHAAYKGRTTIAFPLRYCYKKILMILRLKNKASIDLDRPVWSPHPKEWAPR